MITLKDALKYTALVVCCLSAGCAAQKQVEKRRYFWPPLPDTPRIEFVAAYSSSEDLPKSASKEMMDKLTGGDAPIGFVKPWGITSDGKGLIYITDTATSGVIVYNMTDNTVQNLGGTDASGLFASPVGVVLDEKGNVYVSDPRKNKVFSFTREQKPLKTIGDASNLNWPVGMAIDDKLERLYVVNGKAHNISVFKLSGEFLFNIGKRGAEDGEFNFPSDVDVDSYGNIVVADAMNARVQILTSDGVFIRKFGRRGDGDRDFQLIKGIAVSNENNIYVVDGKAERILVFNDMGESLTFIGSGVSIAETGRISPAGFQLPQDIYIDSNDAIYVVDSLNNRFQVFQIINEDWLLKYPIPQ